MARDSIIADSRAATLGFILFLVTSQITFCFCAPLSNWIDNPCHDRPERQTRHSRDANHSQAWKKQFGLAKNKYTGELLFKLQKQYKDIPNHIFNNKYCPSISLPRKMKDQTPQNYYEAIRVYAILLDQNAKLKDLPKTVNFDYGDRKDLFELAVNITKQLLCEVYDSLPDDNNRRNGQEKRTNDIVKSPYEVTDMKAEDFKILKCFGRFLTMSTNKINGKKKGGGGKGKRGKKNPKVRHHQRKHKNKRKSKTAS